MRGKPARLSSVLVVGLLLSLLSVPGGAQAAPVGPPGAIPTTLVSGPHPSATLDGPISGALPRFQGSFACTQGPISVTLADGLTGTASTCGIGTSDAYTNSGHVSVGGAGYVVDTDFGGFVVRVPNGWLAFSCRSVPEGCILGTTTDPVLSTGPIMVLGGRIGPRAAFSSFTPFEYANGERVVVSTDSVAVSDIGAWLAVKTRGRNSLARIDWATREVLPFAGAVACCQGFPDQTPLAIDDSGQFIAQGRIAWGSVPLAVWDIAPCGPPPSDASVAAGCETVGVATLTGNTAFSPGRAVFLRWFHDRLSFAAGDPGSPFALWELVPESALDAVGVSPAVAPSGTKFTFTFRCTYPNPSLEVAYADGSDTGIFEDSPTSLNRYNFAAAVAVDLPGTFKARVSCGPATVESDAFISEQYKYVALGDSYSAGEGVEPFFDAYNRCHRSMGAYAMKVEQSGVTGESIYERLYTGDELGLGWGFQACSGATTSDMLTEGHHGDALPQLQLDRSADFSNPYTLPVDAETDLVTMTIGGNDVEFSAILGYCYLSANCTQGIYKDGLSLSDYVDGLLARLGPKLDKVYSRVEDQAEHARILVLGYPQLVPASIDEQRCRALLQRGSPWGTVGLTLQEQQYIRSATVRLNGVIEQRAEASGRAEFVRVDRFFAGHEVCGSQGEWINGPSFTVGTGTEGLPGYLDDRSFHPNPCGQDAMAVLVNVRLNASLRDVAC